MDLNVEYAEREAALKCGLRKAAQLYSKRTGASFKFAKNVIRQQCPGALDLASWNAKERARKARRQRYTSNRIRWALLWFGKRVVSIGHEECLRLRCQGIFDGYKEAHFYVLTHYGINLHPSTLSSFELVPVVVPDANQFCGCVDALRGP